MNRPRVLLADDHRIVSEGLRRLLLEEFEFVGIVEDGRSLIAAAKELSPDVVVVDISMPHVNGIDAIPQLRMNDPGVRIVVLTMHQDPAYARRALEAGANGYVVKHSAPAELVMAIKAALRGQVFVSPILAGKVFQDRARNSHNGGERSEALTPRQREILQFLVQGLSAKEIGTALAISSRTVEFHKYQIMETHGIHSNAELFHFAIKHGIGEI